MTLSADSLQQLLLQQQVRKSLLADLFKIKEHIITLFALDLLTFPPKMMQAQLLGIGGVGDAGVLQRLKQIEQQPGDYQALQARIIQLEGQVH